MAVQYNKLWKLLIDKKIKPSALSKMTGIAPSIMAKLDREDRKSTRLNSSHQI